MMPPIFATVNVSAVQALLKTGAGPLRFYAWGKAPDNVEKPYAVWRQVFGLPENYLGDRPDADQFTTQIDVYAADVLGQGADKARVIADAISNAIEGVAYVTSWIGESRDPETKNYVSTFQCDWWVPRP
jgi:hypothetical protein